MFTTNTIRGHRRGARPHPLTPSSSGERGLRSFVLALLLLLPLVLSFPLDAEIVVFKHGSFLHVESYEVEGDRVRLSLPEGGQVVMPLVRVERILDDIIVREPEIPEARPFRLRFDPSHEVPATPYGDLIHTISRRWNLNPELVAAVARAESAFDARAVSVKGAQGLMQLMPATAARFGLEGAEVFEPAKNLDAGARYLAWLVERFEGRLEWVLAAYNAGEGTVDRYQGVPPYRETQSYIKRIYRTLGLEAEPSSGELSSGELP